MFEALLPLLAIIVLIFLVLVYLDVVDLSDFIVGFVQLIGSVLKPIAGLLFAAGAFFVWLIRRGREKSS